MQNAQNGDSGVRGVCGAAAFKRSHPARSGAAGKIMISSLYSCGSISQARTEALPRPTSRRRGKLAGMTRQTPGGRASPNLHAPTQSVIALMVSLAARSARLAFERLGQDVSIATKHGARLKSQLNGRI